MKITKSNCNFEREPLLAPFGFKGGYLSELWQSVVKLENSKRQTGIGLGTQSTLWSDAAVFTINPESAGNSMMFLVTSFAVKAALELDWENPIDLLDKLLPITYEYAKKVTNNPDLRLTFALNALVAVDNAAWLLYCRENNITVFDDMIPADIKPALSFRHDKLAGIPLMSYNVPIEKIIEAVKRGYFFLKIKIGSDPDKDGDQDKMLEWDKQRMLEIHEAVKDIEIPYTETGRILYYFDANGRYENKDRLMCFLDYAEKIGARDRIMVMEEPFSEEYKVDVSDIPVCLAADESAHSDKDVIERIELGYRAIALKPIAKTMSMSLKIVKITHQKNIPCFCADLTVNPVLVDWNKNVAARLSLLPGLKIGVVESNGHQNYKRWNQMCAYHPCAGVEWTKVKDGLFYLDDDFYRRNGGILEDSSHYQELVK
ncbi:L-alanine-DL-glutamate epimerase [bacterium]|nr:L-alanine-DL-glutamate epimerase [bacterium]